MDKYLISVIIILLIVFIYFIYKYTVNTIVNVNQNLYGIWICNNPDKYKLNQFILFI